MALQTQAITRHDLEVRIVRRSLADEAFRRQFIADPAGAIGRYLQIPAASLPQITVHKEGPGSWHIVLPAKPFNATELSDADLARVAGGSATPTLVIGTAIWSGAFTAASISAPVTVAEGGW
jgi:hypothetical protein